MSTSVLVSTNSNKQAYQCISGTMHFQPMSIVSVGKILMSPMAINTSHVHWKLRTDANFQGASNQVPALIRCQVQFSGAKYQVPFHKVKKKAIQ